MPVITQDSIKQLTNNGGSGYQALEGDKIISNIVSKKALRQIELKAITHMASVVGATFGPAASNSLIIEDARNASNVVSSYTKDGHTVLKNVKYPDPIQVTIHKHCVDVTHNVELKVGDGTSTAISLASIMFKRLCEYESRTSTNAILIYKALKKAVDMISNDILSKGKDVDISVIRKICEISTNGNDELTSQICRLYEKYGLDTYINVVESTLDHDESLEYTGLQIDVPYSNTMFINSSNGECRIQGDDTTDPEIYYFKDPINNQEMLNLFASIIDTNIMAPYNAALAARQNSMLDIDDDDNMNIVPTVICAPSLSRDADSILDEIARICYSQTQGMTVPILIITDIDLYDTGMMDIAELCGCRPIGKYINEAIKIQLQSTGAAPTKDNIKSFAGHAHTITSDYKSTCFETPMHMYKKDANGEYVYGDDNRIEFSDIYYTVLNSAKAELDRIIKEGTDDIRILYRSKRRVNMLVGTIVDFHVGGISIEDRTARYHSMEDATLSCRSAIKAGYGRAASYEGLESAFRMKIECDDALVRDMIDLIENSYKALFHQLYGTVYSDEEVSEIFDKSFNEHHCPMNIVTGKYDNSVLTTIETDSCILESIYSIIGIMFTANQALIPSMVPTNFSEL